MNRQRRRGMQTLLQQWFRTLEYIGLPGGGVGVGIVKTRLLVPDLRVSDSVVLAGTQSFVFLVSVLPVSSIL